MFLWISENLPTIIICAVLITVVTLIVVNMIRNKKKGKSSCGCGCGCESCPMGEKCRK